MRRATARRTAIDGALGRGDVPCQPLVGKRGEIGARVAVDDLHDRPRRRHQIQRRLVEGEASCLSGGLAREIGVEQNALSARRPVPPRSRRRPSPTSARPWRRIPSRTGRACRRRLARSCAAPDRHGWERRVSRSARGRRALARRARRIGVRSSPAGQPLRAASASTRRAWGTAPCAPRRRGRCRAAAAAGRPRAPAAPAAATRRPAAPSPPAMKRVSIRPLGGSR